MSAPRRSQKAGTLAELERRGAGGLSSVEMVGGAVDGRPILNYCGRIEELRRDGHRIETAREPNGTARYVLHPPGQPVCAPRDAAAKDAAARLPIGDVAAPRSPLDPWEDA
jgi:hypothetical protein